MKRLYASQNAYFSQVVNRRQVMPENGSQHGHRVICKVITWSNYLATIHFIILTCKWALAPYQLVDLVIR